LGAFLLPSRGFGLAAETGPTALSFLHVPQYHLQPNNKKNSSKFTLFCKKGYRSCPLRMLWRKLELISTAAF
jgi:hypothetical protein